MREKNAPSGCFFAYKGKTKPPSVDGALITKFRPKKKKMKKKKKIKVIKYNKVNKKKSNQTDLRSDDYRKIALS